jgi:hypothetical protein
LLRLGGSASDYGRPHGFASKWRVEGAGHLVGHPVRNAEVEYLDREIDAALDVMDFERNLPKLARTDTVRLRASLRNGAL